MASSKPAGARPLELVVEADVFGLHPPADQLERRKRTVPFVQVHHTR